MRTFLLVAVLCGGSAMAQCMTDADCPAGGTCGAGGACVTPGTPSSATPPVRSTEPSIATADSSADLIGDQAPKKATLGWSPGAAAIGFTGTGLVVSSGIIAMIFIVFGVNAQAVPGALFISVSAALVAGLGLLTHFGAQSAERDDANAAAKGFAITGWVFYGVSLAASVVTFATFLNSSTETVAFFAQMGALITGALSLLFFAIEAVETGSNALRMRKGTVQRPTSSAVQVMPTFAFLPRRDGLTVDPVVGLVGRF
ncbi:MAG: hypothetical protein JNM17_37885 [Archangium sp.]|nr:hypothetical protein [Archangium sp.]